MNQGDQRQNFVCTDVSALWALVFLRISFQIWTRSCENKKKGQLKIGKDVISKIPQQFFCERVNTNWSCKTVSWAENDQKGRAGYIGSMSAQSGGIIQRFEKIAFSKDRT